VADSTSGRHILIPIEVTGAHRDQLDARADSLEQLRAERLDPAAHRHGRARARTPARAWRPVVKGRFSSLPPDVTVWAFQAKQGEMSPVVERPTCTCSPGSTACARRAAPLAAHPSEVEALVRHERKKAEAKKLGESIRDGASRPAGTLEARPRQRRPSSRRGLRAGGRSVQRQHRHRHCLRPPAEPDQPAGRRQRRPVYVMQAGSGSGGFGEFVKSLPSLGSGRSRNAAASAQAVHDGAPASADIVDNRDKIFKTAAQVKPKRRRGPVRRDTFGPSDRRTVTKRTPSLRDGVSVSRSDGQTVRRRYCDSLFGSRLVRGLIRAVDLSRGLIVAGR
jgi:hypothetical protein